MRKFLVLMIVVAQAVVAQAVVAQAVVAQPPTAANQSSILVDQLRAADHRVEIAELEAQRVARRNDILEVKSELENKAYSRLEILSALFALLLTILVVAFGIRTERAAARAAKGELADRQRELDEIMMSARLAGKAAEEAATLARSASASAESHATSAADHLAKVAGAAETIRIAVSEVLENHESKEVTPAAVGDAAATPKAQRTSEEFRVLIRSAYDEQRWKDMIELARGMRFLHGKDDISKSFSLIQESYALHALRRREEHIIVLSEVIDEFAQHENVKVKRDVSFALFSRSLTYIANNKDREALNGLERLISEFGSSDDEEISANVERGLLWKARALGGLKEVMPAIAALESWKERVGTLDCGSIVDNVFFKHIQSDVLFQAYLRENGCLE